MLELLPDMEHCRSVLEKSAPPPCSPQSASQQRSPVAAAADGRCCPFRILLLQELEEYSVLLSSVSGARATTPTRASLTRTDPARPPLYCCARSLVTMPLVPM